MWSNLSYWIIQLETNMTWISSSIFWSTLIVISPSIQRYSMKLEGSLKMVGSKTRTTSILPMMIDCYLSSCLPKFKRSFIPNFCSTILCISSVDFLVSESLDLTKCSWIKKRNRLLIKVNLWQLQVQEQSKPKCLVSSNLKLNKLSTPEGCYNISEVLYRREKIGK